MARQLEWVVNAGAVYATKPPEILQNREGSLVGVRPLERLPGMFLIRHAG